MQVVAVKQFNWQGTLKKPGDRFRMSSEHARMFIGFGKVVEEPAPMVGRPVMAAETQRDDDEQTPRAKRIYRRRDMRAEDPARA